MRKRKYYSNAERQQAYRDRQALLKERQMQQEKELLESKAACVTKGQVNRNK